MLAHELLQLLLARARNRLGHDLAAVPVAGPGHRLLADRPATGVQLARCVLVALLPAEVDLVHLDRTGEQPAGARKALPQAMAEVPGGLLGDAEFAMQLHRGDALQAGGEQIDGEGPGLVAELGVGHDAAGADGEAFVAGAAAVGHGRMRAAGQDVTRAALGTGRAVRPADVSEPPFGGRIIGQQTDHFRQGDAFAEPFAGAFLLACGALHNSLIIQEHALYINQKQEKNSLFIRFRHSRL